MINRFYKEGEKLDVAGLNEIIVLIDRSETELTEVGLNIWRPGLVGPPHRHADKDQIFYITEGKGELKIYDNIYKVEAGNLAFIPAGTVHQTINSGETPLSYILFNIFNNKQKEGHSTFADHIEKVKAVRKKQAETGKYNSDEEEILISSKAAKFIPNIYAGKQYDFVSNQTYLVLDRNQTNGCELTVVKWPPESRGAMVAHKDKEQTFFVLKGKGEVTINNETRGIKPGSVVFVPRNSPHTTEAASEDLVYLCMNSIVDKESYSNFEEMYKSIAPERIKRWLSGSSEVGE